MIPNKDVQTLQSRLEVGHDTITNSCPDVHGGTKFLAASFTRQD